MVSLFGDRLWKQLEQSLYQDFRHYLPKTRALNYRLSTGSRRQKYNRSRGSHSVCAVGFREQGVFKQLACSS